MYDILQRLHSPGQVPLLPQIVKDVTMFHFVSVKLAPCFALVAVYYVLNILDAIQGNSL